MKKHFIASIALAALVAAPAVAADMAPVYKARPSVVTESWYVWVDGFYERVNLPTYGLGFHQASAGTLLDQGVAQTFDPRLNGAGVRGALGRIVPGTNVGIEAGGSFVGASGSASQVTTPGPNGSLRFLNGGLNGIGFSCSGVITCVESGALSTNYSSWQANGKALYDWKNDTLTVTTSGAIFGGTSRAHQTLTQSINQFNGAALANAIRYSADTTLRWTDFGARAGLEANVAVTPILTVGISGWVGAANRNTNFTGTDNGISAPAAVFNINTAITSSETRNVFLANAEAGFALRFAPAVVLRGFAGINYDNGVPGIASGTYAGGIGAPTATTTASIYYKQETSYYAGGGLLWTFGGPVVAKN